MPIDPADPRLQRVAYAKLQGEAVEVFVRKFEVMLGRTSKSTPLDVVLGDNMNISRQHAKIVYNFESKFFELIVMGKNGAHVNGTLYTPASAPQPLYSKDLLAIGDKSFYFLLPAAAPTPAPSAAPAKRPAPTPADPTSGAKRPNLITTVSSHDAGAAPPQESSRPEPSGSILTLMPLASAGSLRGPDHAGLPRAPETAGHAQPPPPQPFEQQRHLDMASAGEAPQLWPTSSITSHGSADVREPSFKQWQQQPKLQTRPSAPGSDSVAGPTHHDPTASATPASSEHGAADPAGELGVRRLPSADISGLLKTAPHHGPTLNLGMAPSQPQLPAGLNLAGAGAEPGAAGLFSHMSAQQQQQALAMSSYLQSHSQQQQQVSQAIAAAAAQQQQQQQQQAGRLPGQANLASLLSGATGQQANAALAAMLGQLQRGGGAAGQQQQQQQAPGVAGQQQQPSAANSQLIQQLLAARAQASLAQGTGAPGGGAAPGAAAPGAGVGLNLRSPGEEQQLLLRTFGSGGLAGFGRGQGFQ